MQTVERLESSVDRPRVSLAVLAKSLPEGFRVLNTTPKQGFNRQNRQFQHFVHIRYDGPLGQMDAWHPWYAEVPDDAQLQLALRSMQRELGVVVH